MTSTQAWLTPSELSDVLGIRLSRVAQLMRVGILPYEKTIGDPLIHRRQIKNLVDLFPELLDFFRAENEGDKRLTEGELSLADLPFQRPSTLKLLKCVQRREGSVPN